MNTISEYIPTNQEGLDYARGVGHNCNGNSRGVQLEVYTPVITVEEAERWLWDIVTHLVKLRNEQRTHSANMLLHRLLSIQNPSLDAPTNKAKPMVYPTNHRLYALHQWYAV